MHIPGDNADSDDFFVHVTFGTQVVNISWQLLSRYYSDKGKLKIVVESEIEDAYKTNKENAGETEIGDYIEVEEVTD